MLYTLVLVVCLNGSPQSCRIHEEVGQGPAGHPGIAFVQAAALVARWLEGNPGYAVERWRLRLGFRA